VGVVVADISRHSGQDLTLHNFKYFPVVISKTKQDCNKTQIMWTNKEMGIFAQNTLWIKVKWMMTSATVPEVPWQQVFSHDSLAL